MLKFFCSRKKHPNPNDPNLQENQVQSDFSLAGHGLVAAGTTATATGAYLLSDVAAIDMESVQLAQKALGKAETAKLLKNLKVLRLGMGTLGVTAAFGAGLTVGDALVEYDKAHWDGRLVGTISDAMLAASEKMKGSGDNSGSASSKGNTSKGNK